MARKKQEIQLQIEIETQEEWEEMLAKEGLTVVDIYQEWSGPCKAMLSNFKKFKNELGDDLLHFAVAKADTVDALDKYRGRCEPCFLFFAGGVLVTVIRGANCPLLQKSIQDQLKTEHRVLDGATERKEIRDPLLAQLGEKEDTGEDETEDEDAEGTLPKTPLGKKRHRVPIPIPVSHVKPLPEPVGTGGIDHQGERVMLDLPDFAKEPPQEAKKGVSVAIIKPDLVQAGKVDEIIEKMKEHGIEILEREERQLTADEVKEFYSHLAEEKEEGVNKFEFFDQLVEFMSSGPSVILVITKGETGDTIIEEWRELIGPKAVEEAKEKAPDSLRAQYGTEKYVNAVHGSDSQETATRELAFFFPSFSVPSVPSSKPKSRSSTAKIERTMALIRPDALRERKDEILAKIQEAGFTVAMQKEMQLTKEQAQEFYKEHKDEAYFDELTNRMSNGPLLALALAREDAVQGWRQKLGPKEVEKAVEEDPESLRAQFAVDGVPINQLHGSDSMDSAQKEIEYFFGPVEQTVAVIKPEAFQTQEEIMKKIKEAGFNIAARKQTDLTKDIAEQFYNEHKDKEYFGELTEHMASGPTLFMVLSREDAVDGWRSLIGPTDPSQAKEEAPDTIRAQFGQDIKANAVHGSSTQDHAQQSIKLVFGDLEFTPEGRVKGGEEAAAEAPAAAAEGEQAGETEDEYSANEEEDNDAEDKDRHEKEEEGNEDEGEDEDEEYSEDDEEAEYTDEDDKRPAKATDAPSGEDGEQKEQPGVQQEESSATQAAAEAVAPQEETTTEAAPESGADQEQAAPEECAGQEAASDAAAGQEAASDAAAGQEEANQAAAPETAAAEEPAPEADTAPESVAAEEAAPEQAAEEAAAPDSAPEEPQQTAETPKEEEAAAQGTDEAPPAAEEAPPAAVETPPAAEETPPAAEETSPAAAESPPAAEETPPATVETPPAAEEAPTPAGEAASVATEEAAPAATDEAASAAAETPQAEETKPEEETPATPAPAEEEPATGAAVEGVDGNPPPAVEDEADREVPDEKGEPQQQEDTPPTTEDADKPSGGEAEPTREEGSTPEETATEPAAEGDAAPADAASAAEGEAAEKTEEAKPAEES